MMATEINFKGNCVRCFDDLFIYRFVRESSCYFKKLDGD